MKKKKIYETANNNKKSIKCYSPLKMNSIGKNKEKEENKSQNG